MQALGQLTLGQLTSASESFFSASESEAEVVFDAWKEHVQLLIDCGDKDNLKKAEVALLKAVKDGIEIGMSRRWYITPSQQAMVLYLLARAYVKLKYWESAESKLNEALEIRKKLDVAKDKEVPKMVSLQGQIYMGKEEYEKAMEKHQKAKELREDLFGKDHQEVAASLSNISKVHRVQKNFAQAKQALEEAYKIQRDRLGKRHKYVAMTEKDMGSLLREMGEEQAAKESIKKAVATLKIIQAEGRDEVSTHTHTHTYKHTYKHIYKHPHTIVNI